MEKISSANTDVPIVVAVVIPCYKVVRHICDVIAGIGKEVARIYCVDDCCPDGSGKHIESNCCDSRVTVLYNSRNLGVGGTTMTGYRRAMQDGAQIVLKIDGDGQMNPALIPRFIYPILASRADYTKGNRFFNPESLRGMPAVRLCGNAALSFITKLSTGYWQVMDPTNGYTAIHTRALEQLPLEKISSRYLHVCIYRNVEFRYRRFDRRSSSRSSNTITRFTCSLYEEI